MPGRRTLARRYAFLLGAVATTLLLLSGALEMRFQYLEARANIATLQRLQAQNSAREIATWLRDVERRIQDVAKMPWGGPGYGPPQEREEFYRLMLLTPAIVSMQAAGPDARERLFVSREDADRIDSMRTLEEPALAQVRARDAVRRGATYFRDGYLPSLRLAVSGGTQVVVAAVDLRLLGDVVSRLRVGERGIAYVVDARGFLIAHPRPTEMLRHVDLSRESAVSGARVGAGSPEAIETTDLAGRPVIATGAEISDTGWIVVVEQPRSEALEPTLATLRRTLLLIGIAVLAAIVASVLFARRMAAPIVALRDATQRIARGDLDTPLAVRSGDEIEGLAEDFNLMIARVRESYASLEARVRDRTLALSEAHDTLEARAGEIARLNERLLVQVGELDVRSHQAERANLSKTRFLAAASHDLRQPMHTIGLLLGLLTTRLANEEQRELAARLGTCVETMERLFNSLLDISKLDAGIVRAQVELFPVQRVLDRIAIRFEGPAAERGTPLVVRRCSAIVRSDPGMLERCLGNLAGNAVNYAGRGRIVLGCRRRGDRLAVQVLDQGPGIPADELETVFEEFVRLPGADQAQARGLGLGLAIVRRTAALLGHPLRVHSRQGHGSCFEIELELHAALPAPDARLKVGQALVGALLGTFVLVVDDDPGNRTALQALCAAWGCLVAVGDSGEGALVELGRHLRAPDLVLTDFWLGGGMDGLALIQRLRQDVDPAIAGLLVTADTAADVLARAQSASVDVLHKPVSPERLFASACAQLGRAANWGKGGVSG